MKNLKGRIISVVLVLSVVCLYSYAIKSQKTTMQASVEQVQSNRALGVKLTNVKLPDINGKMRNLTDFVNKGKNKVVLIDFWATWCGPCMHEMPNVKAAYDKYHKKGFDIVGISFDNDANRWKNTIKQNGWKWHHLSDLKGWQCAAGKVYGIRSIPSSILVDSKGRIIANNLRGEELQIKLRSIFGF